MEFATLERLREQEVGAIVRRVEVRGEFVNRLLCFLCIPCPLLSVRDPQLNEPTPNGLLLLVPSSCSNSPVL